MKQTDLQGETERALRALTCKGCAAGLKIIVHTSGVAVHWKEGTNEGRCTYNPELLPLFNAGIEQAHIDGNVDGNIQALEAVVTALGAAIPQDAIGLDNVKEAHNSIVAGAYAAAAKVVDDCNREGPYQAIGAAERIRALTPTPVDARRALQSYKADLARDLQDPEYSLEYLKAAALDSKEALKGAVENVMGQAIASAEARARLEAEENVFQTVGRMAARHFIDTLKVADELNDEKLRAGAILALEEVWFRMTKHHLDWEELKVELAEAAARTPDTYSRDRVKQLEREMEATGDNRFRTPYSCICGDFGVTRGGCPIHDNAMVLLKETVAPPDSTKEPE